MGKRVDIFWDSEHILLLKANLKWTNKKGGFSFYLKPIYSSSPSFYNAFCDECPFYKNPICSKTFNGVGGIGFCSRLWYLRGDNRFTGRSSIRAWKPVGPIKRRG